MHEYLKLVDTVLTKGIKRENRTGVDTIMYFGYHYKVDLSKGFPLLTTKKIFFNSVIRELLWYLQGETHIRNLRQHTKIWDAWADADGNLGPIYGYQWRFWEKYDEQDGAIKKLHVDQLTQLIEGLKHNPHSRRHIVTAWNVADIDRMALPPCHTFFQCYVSNGHLDLQLYQRSADVAVGVPFNIASYSLLLMMLAKECNLTPRYFVHTIGDAHLYSNHLEGVKEQLKREPKARPQVEIADKGFFDLTVDDFKLTNYTHDAFIKFEVAV